MILIHSAAHRTLKQNDTEKPLARGGRGNRLGTWHTGTAQDKTSEPGTSDSGLLVARFLISQEELKLDILRGKERLI